MRPASDSVITAYYFAFWVFQISHWGGTNSLTWACPAFSLTWSPYIIWVLGLPILCNLGTNYWYGTPPWNMSESFWSIGLRAQRSLSKPKHACRGQYELTATVEGLQQIYELGWVIRIEDLTELSDLLLLAHSFSLSHTWYATIRKWLANVDLSGLNNS